MKRFALSFGERAVRAICGQELDRIPFGVGIGWFPWPETVDRWKAETGNPEFDFAAEVQLEPAFELLVENVGLFPAFEHEVLEEKDGYTTFRDPKGIVMRTRPGAQTMPEFLEYPVKETDDWDQLKEERLRLDSVDKRLEDIDWQKVKAKLEQEGLAGQVGQFPYGIFGTPRDFLGDEELLVSFYTRPEMVRDMMNTLTDLWLAIWERVADQLQIDHIHIWEDMSGRQGSLISPDMVEQFMMPCYDRIHAFARAHNIRVISVDTDGDCHELAPIMKQHGMNLLFPFEVQAGNDIREYRQNYPDLGIMGGLDKRALAKDRAAIDEEIEKCRWMLENGGRYIPGFDHLIPPDVPYENYKYAAEKIRKLCHSHS